MHNKVAKYNLTCKTFQGKTSTWSLRLFNLPCNCKKNWENDVLKIQKKDNVDVYDPNEGTLANNCPQNLQHKKHGG